MFEQIQKIDEAAIKINQAKALMGILIQIRDDIPKKYQDNIFHITYDILSDQEKELIEVSSALLNK
jgi:hypothetical protein